MKTTFFFFIFLTGFFLVTEAQIPNRLNRSERKKGWVLLFDGESTTGWTTISGGELPEGWSIKDGTITATAGGKGGDIITAGEYSNFELSIQYKIDIACNSGVKYLFTKYESGGDLGIEFQILDDELAEDNQKANHLTGSLYDVLPPSKIMKKVNPPGEWNTIRIVVEGGRVMHYLNDFKILEFVRESKAFSDAVANSKFSKTIPAFGTVKKGHILLQEHGGTVSFRNIKIRPL
ncbi:MAG TPA: DUF1080 domain-containing protein [Pedobacter sp.]|nr:DUF1080 domain-containing protein [Pedobacter sp.]